MDFFLEKQPFFRADTARLGKYSRGGYGRIGVYRVKEINCLSVFFKKFSTRVLKSEQGRHPTTSRYWGPIS